MVSSNKYTLQNIFEISESSQDEEFNNENV
jgi:hypothetical protein